MTIINGEMRWIMSNSEGDTPPVKTQDIAEFILFIFLDISLGFLAAIFRNVKKLFESFVNNIIISDKFKCLLSKCII